MSLKSDSETNTSVSLEEEVREINSFSKPKLPFGEVQASASGGNSFGMFKTRVLRGVQLFKCMFVAG